MYVTSRDIDAIKHLSLEAFLAVDTETSGLRPFHGDKLFSIILATADKAWYFDFNTGEEASGGREALFEFLRQLFASTPRVLFLAHAKFDLEFLHRFGIDVHPDTVIHDTLAMGRVINNEELSLSLDALSERCLGERKDDAVARYVEEHGCGYQDVPLDIMVSYAEKDAMLTYRLGMWQLKRIEVMDAAVPDTWPKVDNCRRLQCAVSRVVTDMVRQGVRVDLDYCVKAMEYLKDKEADAQREFERLTGRPFKASSKLLESIFGREAGRLNENGNVSFDKKVLAKLGGEVAAAYREAKDCKKRWDFFAGFKNFADSNGILHTDLNEMRAVTTRFSSSRPNLQNMKRPDSDDSNPEPFPVRRAIVPISLDYCLIPVDYSQQEMRLLLDRANAVQMIDRVLGGTDIHQATADLAGIPRQYAKAVNFGIIFGMGVTALASDLGKTQAEAQAIIDSVLDASPEIKVFIQNIKKTSRERGYVFSWNGQRFHLPRGHDRSMEYVMVNRYIQGGSAEITKYAMVGVHKMWQGTKSYLALPVHDELISMVHRDDLHMIERKKEIMEAAYPYKKLPMVAEVSHSWVSLADKVKGYPTL